MPSDQMQQCQLNHEHKHTGHHHHTRLWLQEHIQGIMVTLVTEKQQVTNDQSTLIEQRFLNC